MSTTFYPEGLTEVGNARANGFSGVTLNQVGIIQNGTELKRLTLGSVQAVTSNTIQVAAIDQSTGEYDCHALKFYTDTGVPFVLIASDTEDPLQVKTVLSDFLLSYELDITPAGSDAVVPSGNPMFLLPIATQALAGAVRIATAAERLALTAGVVPDAPGVAEIVKQVGDVRFAGSGHSHAWSAITGKPSTFTPASHDHPWSAITGKPSTFTPSDHGHSRSDLPIYHDRYLIGSNSTLNINLGQKIDSVQLTWERPYGGVDMSKSPYTDFSPGTNSFSIYNDNSSQLYVLVLCILRDQYDPDKKP